MEKNLKNLFKPYKNTDQVYLNYKGLHIYIDKDEFKRMSEEDILALIKARTTQTSKKRQEEDIVPHDEGRELFKTGLKRIKPENFREFYDSMSNA
jgi:hypothetical protein